jgi:WD40 repeat protein
MQKLTCFIPLAVVVLVIVNYNFSSALGDDAERSGISGFNDEAAPREINRLHVDGYINAVAWAADGSRLAVLSGFGRNITLFRSSDWHIVNKFERYGGAYSDNSLSILPDGSLLTATPAGDYSNDPVRAHVTLEDPRYSRLDVFSLIQWNVETGKRVRYLPDVLNPLSELSQRVGPTDTFVVSHNGLMVAGIWGDKVLIYESQSGMLLKSLDLPPSFGHGDIARSVAFSPNGQELAVGTMNGLVLFIDTSEWSISRSFTAYPNEEYSCSALLYISNGKMLVTGKHKNFDGELRNGVWVTRSPSVIGADIWRVDNGDKIGSLTGSVVQLNGIDEAASVHSLSWIPLASILAIGDGAGLLLWKVTPQRQTLLFSKSIHHGAYSTSVSSQGILAASDNDDVVLYR